MVRSPGFEPGPSARGADVLARLDYDRITCVVKNTFVVDINFVFLGKWETRKNFWRVLS